MAPRSEDPKLIIRVINFELVQPICSAYINVTDRRTDGQTDGRTDDITIAIPREHYVHRAVITDTMNLRSGFTFSPRQLSEQKLFASHRSTKRKFTRTSCRFAPLMLQHARSKAELCARNTRHTVGWAVGLTRSPFIDSVTHDWRDNRTSLELCPNDFIAGWPEIRSYASVSL